MKTELMTITPTIANALLVKNTNNRRLSPRTVELYAREMANGRWEMTHQGIALYDDGVLADGQHRLAAIVKSGCNVQMLVTTGIPRATASGIDAHRARSLLDMIKITGESDWITRKMLEALRLVYGVGKISASESALLAEPIKDSLVYIDSLFKSNIKGTGAPLRATLILAHHYGQDPLRLAQFVEQYYSGFVTSKEDTAVLKIRDYMLSKNTTKYGGKEQRDDFSLCQNAVSKYLSYTPMRVLKEIKETPFPQLDPKPILENK